MIQNRLRKAAPGYLFPFSHAFATETTPGSKAAGAKHDICLWKSRVYGKNNHFASCELSKGDDVAYSSYQLDEASSSSGSIDFKLES